MNEVLIGSLIDKVEAQERKLGIQESQISELTEKLTDIPDNIKAVSELKTLLEEIRESIKSITFPEKEVRFLSARLETTMMILKQPLKREITHHHHITKTIGIAAGLFILVCLVFTGWYNTYNKLEIYKVNDTKYRYVKLNGGPSLNRWLRRVDSLSVVDPDMRNGVIAGEERSRRNFEMWQKSLELEKEAKELKQKISGIRIK